MANHGLGGAFEISPTHDGTDWLGGTADLLIRGYMIRHLDTYALDAEMAQKITLILKRSATSSAEC